MNVSRALFLTAAAAVVSLPMAQADWLHYRGPAQNGSVPSADWNPQMAKAPKTLWKKQVGVGMSSTVVQGERAYTSGNVDGKDILYCLSTDSGTEVWRHSYPMSADPKYFEGGPRATPVVDGNRVYLLGHEGDLWCLDAATGKKVWYQHYVQNFGGRRPDWGYSGSPLVRGNLIYCDVGGAGTSTVALDKRTGAVVWKSGSDQGAYASPVLGSVGGKETLLVFKADALVAYEPGSGQELWRFGWNTSYDVNAASPLIIGGDKVFITSGYGTGCALLQVQGGKPALLWRNKNLRAQINSPVAYGDAIFGIDGDTRGNLTCLALDDGRRLWQEKTVKGASLVVSQGKLIVLTEKGELIVCEASPKGFQVLSQAQVLGQRSWAQPTLDAGRLYLRNNEGELVCLSAK